jgi:hypothetical protein
MHGHDSNISYWLEDSLAEGLWAFWRASETEGLKDKFGEFSVTQCCGGHKPPGIFAAWLWP